MQGCTGARLHWYKVALVQGCTGARLHWYKVHWCRVALVHGYSSARLHWCDVVVVTLENWRPWCKVIPVQRHTSAKVQFVKEDTETEITLVQGDTGASDTGAR